LGPIVHVLHEANVHVVADWFAVDFPLGTIVYISGNERDKNELYKYGHYLLKTANGWMNPWANMPNKRRQSGFIDRPPDVTRIEVALLPK
jgi:hypothetical protein